jgi:murein DD-endopeptidase MepM/ murein hydrolase activator NlpD
MGRVEESNKRLADPLRRGPPLLLTAVFVALLVGTYALWAASSGDEAAAAGIRRGGPTATARATEPKPRPVVVQGTVQNGDTISSLLGEWLTPQEIDLLDRLSRETFSLRKIRRGRPYLIRTLGDQFHSFEYEIDSEERLVIRAEADGFSLAREPIVYEIRTSMVCGTIRSSLFEAAEEIGEVPVLALRLVDIFGWELDFVYDIRGGDTFKAIVEKRYRAGEFAGYGSIPAAEFVNQGKTYQGFLFENRDGKPEYYDEKGRSLRRTLLKTPIDYARISSGFSYNRFHPIKKEWCPHPAIDYAAPVGTPVRTVGDGVVLEAGRKNASGKYIKIRHNSVYQTYYLHLSRFAKGVRKGKKVRQGQVIGYVGSTGMSTGPHLDFRMKKNGKYVNPRRVMAPASPPVPKERIEEYRGTIEPFLAQLDNFEFPIAMETSGETAKHPEERQGRKHGEPSTVGGRGGL